MTALEDRTTHEWTEIILAHVKVMPPVAQTIFFAGVNAAFIDRVVSVDVMEARTTALMKRHMAGEELTAADLESIRAPETVGQANG